MACASVRQIVTRYLVIFVRARVRNLQIPARMLGLRACPAPPLTTVALADDATAVIWISKR